MPSSRKEQIAASFASRAAQYEQHAHLQAEIAAELATMFPELNSPEVLEIGCGTGLLTRHLVARYPDANLLVTDIAEAMIVQCRAGLNGTGSKRVRFNRLDANRPQLNERFDLIATSMTMQWLEDPVQSLRELSGLLKPDGSILYATLAPGCFPEWNEARSSSKSSNGFIEMPALPGVLNQKSHEVSYESATAFLKALKQIGANTPRSGYVPMGPGRLRSSLRELDRASPMQITWKIAYGRVTAETWQTT